MSTQVVDLVRDSTMQKMQAELVAVHKASVLASGSTAAIDQMYNALVNNASTVAEVNGLFVQWWRANWTEGTTTRNELLERWFGTVLDDDRVHGVKFPLFATSNTAIGELTDDSAGLACTPSTEATAEQDDFAHLPQFWSLLVAAEKNADGSHTIYAVEFIDSYDEVRGGTHLCWALQKNTYTREWNEDGYRYFKMQCRPATGYDTWPQGTDRTGKVHAYIGNPAYCAGLDANGLITCGTGLPPVNYSSHSNDVTLWRKRGAQYSGASGNLLKWQLAMVWLKYCRKGNSGTIEGCSSYSYQYKAAVAETGVTRVLLTEAQANNLLVGSSVNVGDVGTGTSTDRGVPSMYKFAKNARIKSIESVSVGGTTYKAVNIDVATPFDVTTGTYISTMPYWSGWNDTVQGYDGSRYSPTSGKEPGLIQRTEFQTGSYLILSDELWQWGQDSDGNYTFDRYVCHDQSKVNGSSITSDYTKQEDLTLVLPAGSSSGWWYIEDTAVAEDKAVLWPDTVSTVAGSGTGCKAGFYVGLATSGVRAAWACCYLHSGGYAGLPARFFLFYRYQSLARVCWLAWFGWVTQG